MKFSVYFPREQSGTPCGGELLLMPLFWLIVVDGVRDAVICERHADWYLAETEYPKGYLRERILQAKFEHQTERAAR